MPYPRKPTALKLLHGDDKKNPQRINRSEPKPGGDVVPPEWLSKSARAIWDDLSPGMIATGVLTSWDVPMMAELCEALILLRAARIRAGREIISTSPPPAGGTTAVNQWLKTNMIVLRYAAVFGVTPADRTRLSTPEATRGQNDDLYG